MEFEKVVERRRSIRSLTDEDVDESTIRRIIELGHDAPSAGNLQARDFIIVRDDDEKDRLASNAYGQRFISEAPWAVVVCANLKRSAKKYGERGRELYSIQDASAAVENMLLAITDMGLGAVWVGAFDERRVSEQLDIPDGVRPVAIIPIGHPSSHPPEPDKMNTEDLIHRDGW